MCFLAICWVSNVNAQTRRAPDFSLKDMNGKEISLSSIKGKEKIVIFFWAIWCPHCQTALKRLNQQPGNYKLVTINIAESQEKVKAFMQRNGYNFVVLFDQDQEVALSYDVVGIPTFFEIDQDLNITYKGYEFPPDLK
jgi:peroxiredoxin